MTVTIRDPRAWKSEGRRFAMLTAYDFPTAQILDAVGIPILLVGDSLGRNVLGYPNELPVTMEEMLHHTRAVVRGAEHALVVGDLPFMSFQTSVEDGIRNAGRFVKEAGAHAVKIEGPQLELTNRLVEDPRRRIVVRGQHGEPPTLGFPRAKVVDGDAHRSRLLG